jgi:hypothetical protein
MRVQGLDLRILDVREVDGALLDRCFRLRAELMGRKPTVRVEDDRAAFDAWMRRDGCMLAVARDGRGDVQTFIEMNAEVIEDGSAPHLVLYSNFVFVAEAYRRHPALVLGTTALLASHLRRRGIRRPTHWLIGVYPTAFLLAARIFGRIWIVGEPGVPAALDGLAERMARRLYGDAWRADRRLVEVRTLPRDFQPRGAEAESHYARYVARNPDWRAGYNVLALVPIDARSLGSLLSSAARRAQERLGVRRAATSAAPR